MYVGYATGGIHVCAQLSSSLSHLCLSLHTWVCLAVLRVAVEPLSVFGTYPRLSI